MASSWTSKTRWRGLFAVAFGALLITSTFSMIVLSTSPDNRVEAYIPAVSGYSFVAAGDFGCSSGDSPFADDVVREANELNPDKFLMLGDFSYTTTFDCFYTMMTTEANALFEKSKDPISVLIANHEVDGCAVTCLNPTGEAQFFGNYTIEDGELNTGYSFDQNGVHFLMLNSEESLSSTSEQFAFAKKDLKLASLNDNINWIVVGIHDPFYISPANTTTTKTAGSNITVFGENQGQTCPGPSYTNCAYKLWHPLFDQNRVDFVLSGDRHAAERLRPMYYDIATGRPAIDSQGNSTSYTNPEGQIYLTIGTGGRHGKGDGAGAFPHNTFNVTSRPAMSAVQNDQDYGFYKFVIDNSGSRMTGTFIDETGASKDSFSITKNTKYSYSPYYQNNTINTIPYAAAQAVATDFSVSAWFRINQDLKLETTKPMIINRGGFSGGETSGKNMNYGIWMIGGNISGYTAADAGKIEAGFETNGGGNHQIKSLNRYNDGKWHMATVVFDYVTSGNNASVTLYVDGGYAETPQAKTGISNFVAPDTLPANTTTRITTQADAWNNNDRRFYGNVDEGRVFNRVLTLLEVQALYNSNTVPSNQVAYLSAANEAGAVYRSNTGSLQTVKYREWNGTAWGSTETALPTAGSNIREARIYQSPVSAQKIVMSLSENGEINMYECDGSCTVTNNWDRLNGGTAIGDMGTPDSSKPYVYFDGAYETASGKFLAVYDKDGNVTSDFYYRTYDSITDTLSGEIGYNYSNGSNNDAEELRYFDLASNPKNDEITMLVNDAAPKVIAFIWNKGGNGGTWSDQHTLSAQTTAVTHEMGVAYETSNGYPIIFASKGSNGAVWGRYVSSWTTSNTDPNPNSANQQTRYSILKSDPSPTSNKVMICQESVSGTVISCAQEDNGTLGSWTVLTSSPANTNRRNYDFAYDPAGSTGLAVYANSTSGKLEYRTWGGSSFGTELSIPVAGLANWISGDGNINSAKNDPIKSLWTKLNNSNDIGALKWDGTTLTLISDSSPFTADTTVQTFEANGIAFDEISPPLN